MLQVDMMRCHVTKYEIDKGLGEGAFPAKTPASGAVVRKTISIIIFLNYLNFPIPSVSE